MDHWQAFPQQDSYTIALEDQCVSDYEEHLCSIEEVTLWPPTLHPNGVGNRYTTDVVVGHRQDSQNGFEPVSYHFEREFNVGRRTASRVSGTKTEVTYTHHMRWIGDTWPTPCQGSQPTRPWLDTCWPQYDDLNLRNFWIYAGGEYVHYDDENTITLAAEGLTLEVVDRTVTEGNLEAVTASYHEFTTTEPAITGPVALEIMHYSGTALFAELTYTAGGSVTVMLADAVSIQPITPQKVSRHPQTGTYLHEPTATDGVQWL